MAVAAVELDSVTKVLDDRELFRSLSLRFEEATITAVLAPSGAGKTTLLRMIAGLAWPTSGTIHVWGKNVRKPSSELGFVFQESSVFPWLTARQNIEFGLSLKANRPRAQQGRVDSVATETGLIDSLNVLGSRLSGGEAQRVAVARALVLSPRVLLLDEPFSQLDDLTRHDLRRMVMRVQRAHSLTALLVTHNVDDAVEIANRILVFSADPMDLIYDSLEARDESVATDAWLDRNTVESAVRRAMRAAHRREEEL